MDNLPKNYNAADIEKKWLAAWQESGIYHWDPNRGREETFVVDSPPPTVSGSLHVGHVFSYTHQDLIVRYQRMTGKNIFYPMGWDDNGLPTERRVQNLFNVRCDTSVPYVKDFVPKKDKKHVELVSRENFIELCQQVTVADEEAFKALWSHLGLSIDWRQEYSTIDKHCRRTSQLSFLELLKAGEAYSVTSPTLWDVDFQTAVSQAEVVDKNVASHFHDIRFGIEGGGSFVIATTRPELLPACVAVIAHPDDERYKPLFGKKAITPLFRVPVPIIADEHADPEKGTGILMICTFGDVTDAEIWRQQKLPLRQVLNKAGRLIPLSFGKPGWESLNPDEADRYYQEIEGKNVKQAREIVVRHLREESGEALPGLGAPLVNEPKPLEHAVKMYEKGERPLEIITSRQWFIKIMDKKQQLLDQGAKIQWHPAFMKHRYDNWVEGLNQDWCISRQRYFGVPFPVWYPLDEKGNPQYDKVIMPDEKVLPIDPMSMPAPGYEESQRGKPGGFIGDPDVMDTWATSSLTPQVMSYWAEDPERHKKLFPMDIRPQSHEIIRTWAFYTIAKALMHHNEIPWYHVIISGWILDPDRKKMSKSQGNVVTPDDLLIKYSSDGVRYWAARARLGVDTAYDESVFNKGKRLATKIFNASRLVAGYLLGRDQSQLTTNLITQPLDRSFIEHLRGAVRNATQAFEQFEYAEALLGAEGFFWAEMCDNYLELVKARLYLEQDTPEKMSALATLKLAHSMILRLFAPFVPYITEEIWSWLYTGEGRNRSVHTAPWPTEAELEGIPAPPEKDPFNVAVEILKEVRKIKSEANQSIKVPMGALTVIAPGEVLAAAKAILPDVVDTVKASDSHLQEGEPEIGLLKVEAVLNTAGE